jgi:hypothetical protein
MDIHINDTFQLSEKEGFQLGNIGNGLSTPAQIFQQIFTASNVVYLLWFLAAYIILYFLMKTFRRRRAPMQPRSQPRQIPSININTGAPVNGIQRGGDLGTGNNPDIMSISRSFDFFVFAFITIALVILYFTKSQEQKEAAIEKGFGYVKEYISSPITLFSISFFLFVFYFAIYLIGIPMSRDVKPYSIALIEGAAWVVFAVVILVSFFRYVLNINVAAFMDKGWKSVWKKYDADQANARPVAASVPENAPAKPEVFNIANNIYTYDDAADVCSVFGARLATYDDIEKSYNDGGEWCNYGWSEGQSAYFPTQKDTWKSLQGNPKHKNDCGRPGVNGGYIDNPNVRFGVNCYGVKPKSTHKDLAWMKAQDPTMHLKGKNPEDIFLEAKIKFWTDNSNNMLKLNSFNRNKWTEY